MANGTQKKVFKRVTILIPFCRQTLVFAFRPTLRRVEPPSATNPSWETLVGRAGAGRLWPHTPWTHRGVKRHLPGRGSFPIPALPSAWVNGCFAPPRSSPKRGREIQSMFGLSVGEFPGFISSNGPRQRPCQVWRWDGNPQPWVKPSDPRSRELLRSKDLDDRHEP